MSQLEIKPSTSQTRWPTIFAKEITKKDYAVVGDFDKKQVIWNHVTKLPNFSNIRLISEFIKYISLKVIATI